MGQGIWLDSDKLGPEDEVGEVLKHGTLTVGFIGLAECLSQRYPGSKDELGGRNHGRKIIRSKESPYGV